MKRAGLPTYDVYVGNFDSGLANDVVEKKVSKVFTKFGETKGLFVKESNQGKFVVVKYLCEQDADKAVADCNGALLDGVPVRCSRMEKRANKPGGPGGGAGPGGKDGQQKKAFQKNPDIVPSVEPRSTSSPSPSDGEPGITQTAAPLPWNPRNQMSVMITHVETPTLVWAQLVSDSTIEEQLVICNKLAELCPTAPTVQGRTEPTKIYGAKFSEDGQWYRCQVRIVFTPEKAKVQYIDFGNTEEMNPKELVELPEELTTPKPFAIKIMFHNIRYINSKEKEAIAYLKEVTEGNYVTVTPTFRLPDGSGQFASLSMGNLNLNQELVDKGFATQKQPKQSQGPGGGGDSFGRALALGGDIGGGYAAGMGNVGVNMGAGDATFRQGVANPSMQAAGRGGQPGKVPLLGESQPVYSDLKIELKNKARALEKASKEKEIAGAELNSLRGKMKNLQTEFTALTNRLQENSIALQIQSAVSMVDKVRKLRSQFSDEESTPLDEAIELAASENKLREESIASLPPLMVSLKQYREQQQEICQFKDQPVPEEKLESRDAMRKQLYQHLTQCLEEMEQKPFTVRAHSITQCIEKLHSHYDNFFSMPVQQFSDLSSIVKQYEEFKTSRSQDFAQTRLLTDQQQKEILAQLEVLSKQLSLSSDIPRDGSDVDLGGQLRLYCSCLQHEMACKNVEGSTDAAFIASLVKSVHHELKAEVLCANNFIRLQSEFTEMRSNMEDWLDKKPSAEKLLANRRTLKALKSKLRHRLADKHDAEENEDEELEEIKKDIKAIQAEIHEALKVEEKELAELATMIDSHFPELLALHPDCGLDIQLAYNGLMKASHEVDHYDLTPVPGSSGQLFYSTFAGKPVIIMECLLSDGHHLGRDDFLNQLTNYTSIVHPCLLRPSAVFFDKNNRHAYMQIEKEGDILANYVEFAKFSKQESDPIMRSVAVGLKALHENKVLHGEINPHCIIRHEDSSAALLPPDFSCRPVDRAKNKYVSPNGLEFLAPEMLTMPAGMEPTGTVDMYCLGILFLWMWRPTDPISFNPDGSLDVTQFQLDPMTANVVKSLSSHLPHMRPSTDMLLHNQCFGQAPGSRGGVNTYPSPSQSRQQPQLGLFSAINPMTEAVFMPNLQQPPPPLPVNPHLPPLPPLQAQLPPPSVHSQQLNTGPLPGPSPAHNSYSDLHQNPAFNGYPQAEGDMPVPGAEMNGFGARLSSGYTSAADCMTSVTAIAAPQDCGRGGFEEAALQQEQQEAESRQAVDQYDDADQGYAGMGDTGDDQGSFEIGTFSVEDFGGMGAGGGDGLRGRKITRQPSGEGDEWGADAASEEAQGDADGEWE